MFGSTVFPCVLCFSCSSTAFGKESEVLIGNLGDKLIPQQEILRDVSDLKALANMHESLEWLSNRMKAAFSNLPMTQSKWSPKKQEYKDNFTPMHLLLELTPWKGCIGLWPERDRSLPKLHGDTQ